ncbi:MAG: hypothetical protein WCI36_00440 [bacterium]
MDNNFKTILGDLEIKLPKGLKQAVFARIEMENQKSVARKLLLIRIGFVFSGISSFAALAIFGKELLLSEFFSITLLVFSDLNTISMMWQDYTLSLLETMPTVSISMTLLPIFVFMFLLRQYGKLQSHDGLSSHHVSLRL